VLVVLNQSVESVSHQKQVWKFSCNISVRSVMGNWSMRILTLSSWHH